MATVEAKEISVVVSNRSGGRLEPAVAGVEAMMAVSIDVFWVVILCN